MNRTETLAAARRDFVFALAECGVLLSDVEVEYDASLEAAQAVERERRNAAWRVTHDAVTAQNEELRTALGDSHIAYRRTHCERCLRLWPG